MDSGSLFVKDGDATQSLRLDNEDQVFSVDGDDGAFDVVIKDEGQNGAVGDLASKDSGDDLDRDFNDRVTFDKNENNDTVDLSENNDNVDLSDAIGDAFRLVDKSDRAINDDSIRDSDIGDAFDKADTADNNADLANGNGDAFNLFTTNNENQGDKSLDDAINEAFKDSDEADLPQSTNTVVDENLDDAINEAFTTSKADLSIPTNSADDENLDDAISDAFKSSEVDLPTIITEGENLDDAINEAFKTSDKVDSPIPNSTVEENLDDAISEAFTISDKVDTTLSNNAVDENLDDAISEAFTTSDKVDIVSPNSADEHNLDDVIGDVFKSIPKEEEADIADKTQNASALDNKDDDLDLENAIGAAFEKFTGSIGNNVSSTNYDTSQIVETVNDGLEGAIDGAFKDLDPNNTDSIRKSESKESDSRLVAGDDEDLESAIGNVFVEINQSNIDPILESHSDPSKVSRQNDAHTADDDNDLEAAIGDAFQRFSPQKAKTNHYDSNGSEFNLPQDESVDLTSAIDDVFKSSTNHQNQIKDSNVNDNTVVHNSHDSANNNIVGDEPSDNEELDEAIGNAFKNIFETNKPGLLPENEFEDQSDDALDNAIGNALQSISTSMPEKLNQRDVFSRKDDNEGNTLDDNELSQLISASFNKLMNNDEQPTEKDQNEEDNMEDAIAQAFRSAINDEPRQSRHLDNFSDREVSYKDHASQPQTYKSNEKEKVLEQLEMNEILHNAFQMAMERPSELVNDDSQNQQSGDTEKFSTATSTLAEKLATTISNYPSSITESTTEFLESLKRSSRTWDAEDDITVPQPDITEVKDKPQEVNKDDHELSLLASSLLLDTNATSQMSPQLLTVIGSITSRIAKSGVTTASDANILSVIRSMRDAFSTNLKDLSLQSTKIPTSTEIIANLKSNDERLAFCRTLNLAKNYIDSNWTEAENFEFKDLIDNVFKKFNLCTNFSDSNNALVEEVDDLFRIIDEAKNSVLSIIGNNDHTARYRTDSSIPDRFTIDSAEYKERLKIENRERKKRWRDENTEKNKDIDLRVRVSRRAAEMFGTADSTQKSYWIEKEFQKRRNKRLLRSKKDDDDFRDERSLKEASETIAQDVSFSKAVTGIFNLFASYTNQEDVEVVLMTSSIVTASAAAVYTLNNPSADFNPLITAVETVFTRLMYSYKSSNYLDRITTLAKAIQLKHFGEVDNDDHSDAHQHIPEITDAEFSSIMTGNIAMVENYSSDASCVLADEISNLSKRTTPKPLESNMKDSRAIIEANFSTKRKLDVESSGKNYIQDNVTMTDPHWNKMPPYKKPLTESLSNVTYPTLTLPTTSPFISNKQNFGNSGRRVDTTAGGLRKPGSFQKPLHTNKPNTNLFGSHQYN